MSPRAAALIALLLALLVLPAGPAAAHDELLSTEPAADAVLDAPPAALALEFSADVLEISPTIVLTGPTGEVSLDPPAVAATRVSVPVPADLAAGAYTVIWRVVSADGHPIQGSYGFTVQPAPEPSPSASPTDPPTPTPTPSTTTTAPGAGPSPAPSATAADEAGSGTTNVAGLVAGLAVLAALVTALVVVRRRR